MAKKKELTRPSLAECNYNEKLFARRMEAYLEQELARQRETDPS